MHGDRFVLAETDKVGSLTNCASCFRSQIREYVWRPSIRPHAHQIGDPEERAVLAALAPGQPAQRLRARGACSTCCSIYLVGRIFPLGMFEYSHYDLGSWVATAATLAMSAGGILVVVGAPSRGNGFARRT